MNHDISNNTYANMIPRNSRPVTTTAGSSSSPTRSPNVTSTTSSTKTTSTSTLPLLTEEEIMSEQPPPPPKTRPPAMTPPPLPPVTSSVTTTTSSQQSSTTIYSTVKHNRNKTTTNDTSPCVPDHLLSLTSDVQKQQPLSHVRTYVRSPGNFLSSSVTPIPIDEEAFLNSLSREDLIARSRIVESKNRKLILDNGQMMKDLNHHVNQLQTYKHSNFQLRADNHELRDLCCYLDDERNRARTLAKEWQSFGTQMSRIMRHEVATYAKKLQQLEEKQFELVKENFELKQLCVLLDNALYARPNNDNNHHIVGVGPVDGSTGSGSMTSSTNEHDSMTNNHHIHHNNNPGHPSLNLNRTMIAGGLSMSGGFRSHQLGQQQQQHPMTPTTTSTPTMLNPQTLEYIRSLEHRIRQLEYEKRQLTSDVLSNTGTIDSTYTAQQRNNRQYLLPPMSPTRELSSPPTVAEAMKALKIRGNHEGSSSTNPRPPHAKLISTSAIEAGDASSTNGTTKKKESHTEESLEHIRSFGKYVWGKIEDTGSRILSSGRRTRSLSRTEARSRKKSL